MWRPSRHNQLVRVSKSPQRRPVVLATSTATPRPCCDYCTMIRRRNATGWREKLQLSGPCSGSPSVKRAYLDWSPAGDGGIAPPLQRPKPPMRSSVSMYGPSVTSALTAGYALSISRSRPGRAANENPDTSGFHLVVERVDVTGHSWGWPVARPSLYSRTAGPEFDKLSKKFSGRHILEWMLGVRPVRG